jgi:hypothetical protein
MNQEETEVLTYQGFQIFIPSFMSKVRPYIYIKNNSKYIIDLGAESNIMRRIDEFFDGFSDIHASYKATLNSYYVRQSELTSALAGKIGYQDKIEELLERLKEIDEKLGVKHE